ncbi:MAG TPA: phytochelatin synthase family protein [Geminicoccaceae bacterium]|nr:phytochelatin synthase family protein [Geminicoccaceae bacterium]
MIRRIVRSIAVALSLLGTTALADTLPLPDNLVDVRSEQGERLLLESDALEAYVPLSVNFLTQKNQAFCGVASIVMVLNALEVPAPTTPEYEPYRTFTQDNFLDERTETILPREVLMKQGMTLDELGRLLALHPVEAEVRHAADSSLEAFRAAAREHLGREGRAVIVNYLRLAIGQERGGHISPLGAYDAETDRFLILDVARYKYPPVWVKADELFAAMNTPDADNQNRTRGYVLVRKTETAATTSLN